MTRLESASGASDLNLGSFNKEPEGIVADRKLIKLATAIARIGGSTLAVVAVATSVVAAEAEAHSALTSTEATRLSFYEWPASTLTHDASGDLSFGGKKYYIACHNGTNRVTDSNAKLGNGKLGTPKDGDSRYCTGFEY
jgi:hypothetical protein